jgi:hypothetical protein
MSKDNKQLTSNINAAKEALRKTIFGATKTGKGTYSDLEAAKMRVIEAYGILRCLSILEMVDETEANYYYGEIEAVEKMLADTRRKQEEEAVARHLGGAP